MKALKQIKITILICLFLLLAFIGGYVIINTNSGTNAPTPTNIPIPSTSPKATPTSALPTSTPKPTYRPIPTLIPTLVNTSANLDELFSKYGARYNVAPELLKKIAGCESGFDPNQITGDYAGLFQFASFAWVEARGRMGLSDEQNLRFNAEESIKTAAFEINYKGTSGWSDCD